MRPFTPSGRIIAAVGLLALMACTAVAKSGGSSVLPDDNAPFFTGNPDAAAIKARTETRLQLAQAALDKTLKVKGKRTVDNTLVPFDEVSSNSTRSHADLGTPAAFRSVGEVVNGP